MKRIAALAGVVAAGLAIPGTAMAGTGSAGGSAPTGQGAIQVRCAVSGQLPPGQVKVAVKVPPKGAVPPAKQVRVKQVPVKARPLPPVRVKNCPVKPPRPAPQPCLAAAFTFDMPAWSRTATEVSGPKLVGGEQVYYHDTTYSVTSVRGDTFTVSHDGTPVLNRGSALTGAIGYTRCGAGQKG